MSARCTAAVFDRYPAGGGEFALALALADNAHDDGGRIFPSVETMAHKSRQSVRAVQMHLRAMIASGWLLKVRDSGGRGRPAEYRISPNWLNGADFATLKKGADFAPIQKGADIAPFQGDSLCITAPESTEKGCNLRQERVQNEAQKGAKRRTPYITVLTSIEPTPLPPADAVGANAFDDFWTAYPRKVGQAQARQEWAKLAPDEALCKRIGSAVRMWARHPEWQRNDGQFIPKPARWLREGRWSDEPGVALAPPPSAPPPCVVSDVPLTPEQLRANKERAAAAVAMARELLGRRAA
jgi:hypothetical protein